MEPQIRYVTSADGTRIAMSTLGQGRPLVVNAAVGWFTMEAYWQLPLWRKGFERLVERRMIVLYDSRGQGLSGREASDFSFEAKVADLTAVVDGLGSTEVDVMGLQVGVQVAIGFAAENRELVRRLVLNNAVPRGRDIGSTPVQRVLRPLIETDWPSFVRFSVLDAFGWETGRQMAEMAVDAITPETFLAAYRASREYDVTHLLSQVLCTTLVIHARSSPIVRLNFEAVKQMTASIPHARLVQYEGGESGFFLANEASLRLIEAFLSEEESAASEASGPSGTAVILFADIVDSTGLTERMGDGAFREKARGLDAAMRKCIRDHAGTPVEGKTLGDGVLAVFSSAKQAIACARACHDAAGAVGLALHAGIHAGDVTREKDPDGRDNVYGGAVNIAARVAAASAAGETPVSATVRELARTSAGVVFEDRGEQALKGIDDPVRVWAVRQA